MNILKKPRQGGFTIVELLIVIVVIGILAAIVLNTFVGAQERAAATTIADGIKKAEKSLKTMAIDTGAATWWEDTTLTGSGNPRLSNIPGFNRYMNDFPAPAIAGSSGIIWRYDNDVDTYNGCSTDSDGVNVYITNFTNASVAAHVDRIIDDNNTACGRLRYHPVAQQILYLLDTDQNTDL
ncbi:prepilin-type N-terminal cleavage/methylation domain-containing protein [Candidatus Saccharibacteria bacterium]|nr:prepilin-type N-terminal cleavage/methylation domain-containing protein [Candidatus Saccharibacteria bacterium]